MIARSERRCASLDALILTASLVPIMGCHPSPIVRGFTADQTEVVGDWNQVFTAERKIELQVPQSGPPLLQVGQIVVGKARTLFIADGRGKRILAFDPEGRLVHEIRGDDSSFKLSSLGPIAVDPDGNVVAFDRDGRWVTVLDRSGYRVVRRFQLSTPVAELLALRGGDIVTYFPADKKVFRKFDQGGGEVAAVYHVRDDNLRIFHGRVQTGGITQGPNGDLFGLQPSAFELVHLSSSLRILELFRGAGDDSWAPEPVAFPRGLDPYDYRPAHEKWWDSFIHIGRPYALTQDVLLVTLFASRGLAETQDFANVYRWDGHIAAEGLHVPHGGHIVGADGGAVYVVRNAILGPNDSIEPLELYEYHLRASKK